MSNVALALLAQDKYKAVVDPVKYMASEKRPVRRLAAVVAVVAVTDGILLIGDLNKWNGWITFTWMHVSPDQLARCISDAIRTLYSFMSLGM